ncbi:MAG TPA: hypothetical protein VH877_22765 [Polyangia bacterium]|nr:hypothetical protein [Polyangia bacterium]
MTGIKEAAQSQKLSPITEEAVEGFLTGFSKVAKDPQQRKAFEQGMQAMFQALGNAMGPALEKARPEMRAATREAMLGMIDAMTARQPEMAAFMQQMSQTMGRGLMAGMATEMQAQLGPDGKGPMARTLGATAQNASSALAGGLMNTAGGVDPCKGQDPSTCHQGIVERYSRAMGAGIAQGIDDETSDFWTLALAFGVGILFTILVGAALRYLLARRRPERPILVQQQPTSAPA